MLTEEKMGKKLDSLYLNSYHGEEGFIALPLPQMTEYRRPHLLTVRSLSQDAWRTLESKAWVSQISVCPERKTFRRTELSPQTNTRHNCQQCASKENKKLKIEICNAAEWEQRPWCLKDFLPCPLRCINVDICLIFLELFPRLTKWH